MKSNTFVFTLSFNIPSIKRKETSTIINIIKTIEEFKKEKKQIKKTKEKEYKKIKEETTELERKIDTNIFAIKVEKFFIDTSSTKIFIEKPLFVLIYGHFSETFSFINRFFKEGQTFLLELKSIIINVIDYKNWVKVGKNFIINLYNISPLKKIIDFFKNWKLKLLDLKIKMLQIKKTIVNWINQLFPKLIKKIHVFVKSIFSVVTLTINTIMTIINLVMTIFNSYQMLIVGGITFIIGLIILGMIWIYIKFKDFFNKVFSFFTKTWKTITKFFMKFIYIIKESLKIIFKVYSNFYKIFASVFKVFSKILIFSVKIINILLVNFFNVVLFPVKKSAEAINKIVEMFKSLFILYQSINNTTKAKNEYNIKSIGKIEIEDKNKQEDSTFTKIIYNTLKIGLSIISVFIKIFKNIFEFGIYVIVKGIEIYINNYYKIIIKAINLINKFVDKSFEFIDNSINKFINILKKLSKVKTVFNKVINFIVGLFKKETKNIQVQQVKETKKTISQQEITNLIQKEFIISNPEIVILLNSVYTKSYINYLISKVLYSKQIDIQQNNQLSLQILNNRFDTKIKALEKKYANAKIKDKYAITKEIVKEQTKRKILIEKYKQKHNR